MKMNLAEDRYVSNEVVGEAYYTGGTGQGSAEFSQRQRRSFGTGSFWSSWGL